MTTPTTDARERPDDLLAWAADGLEHAQTDELGEHDDIDMARVVRLRTLDREIRESTLAACIAKVEGMGARWVHDSMALVSKADVLAALRDGTDG